MPTSCLSVTDVTFENFATKCSGKRDYMISTSPKNDDGQHPVEVSDLTLNGIDEDSKVFYHRPNVGSVGCIQPVTKFVYLCN